MSFELYNDETIEDLQLNGLKLIQKRKAFRFGMDSVILAHFADIRKKDVVADFGTGNGILIFLLYGRNKGSQYFGLDIQEDAVNLSKRNVNLNHLENCTTIICSDAKDASKVIPFNSVDAVICNPPYGQPLSFISSPDQCMAIARYQESDTLDRFFSGAFDILKGKGKLCLIYPAAQMLHIMKLLQSHHLEPKKFRLIYPKIHKPANLVLIEAVKDAKPTLHPLPPLIVYEEDGSLTNELKSVSHINGTY